MEVRIEDYLSDNEIHNIVAEEFREKVQESLRRNGVTTFIANLGYQNVFEQINKEAPNFEEDIKIKTKEVIDNLSSYSVFRKKDLVDREDSLAQKYLEQAGESNKNLIEQKVIEILNKLGKDDISYEISSIIEDKICNLFKGED